MPVELGYFAAITGRFSSKCPAVGLNLHSIPKRLVEIAKPWRSALRAEPGFCYVRADLANVEYRLVVLWTECVTGLRMFDRRKGGSVDVDPYIAAWASMTGRTITKKDPARQVAKAAVLGLSFLMSAAGYVATLQKAIRTPGSGLSEDVLRQMVEELGWRIPERERGEIQGKTMCSETIACCAYAIHKRFGETHGEIAITADWLVATMDRVASCNGNVQRAREVLGQALQSTRCPPAGLIGFEVDGDFGELAVRVSYGDYPATLTWRNPARRVVLLEPSREQLTIIKEDGSLRKFTRQLAIENVTQAIARNALCEGIRRLSQDHGFEDVLHVHDEVLIRVPRERTAVLRAHDALMSIFGTAGVHSLGWAAYVKPSEITVTQSLWESEEDIDPRKGNRWGIIQSDAPDALSDLP